MRTIADLGDLTGKRVLVRADLNVPLESGRITDDGRIQASVPTIKALLEAGAGVIVTAHLGRPGGEIDRELSLDLVAERLGELLETQVQFWSLRLVKDVIPDAQNIGAGQVALIDNIRFDSRETSKNDADREALAAELAQCADYFVSDGFGVVHRKQASVYDVAKLLPSAAGLLVEHEVQALGKAINDPKRPLTVVLGGSKVSDKIAVIENVLQKAERILIGGGMAFTFLAAQGYEVGRSLLETEFIEKAKEYLDIAKTRGVDLVLPSDVVVSPEFSASAPATQVDVDAIPADQMGLDIGPKSAAGYSALISDSQTVVWNGPMGVFEFPAFAQGTKTVAQALVDSPAYTIVGGGDSAAAVRAFGFDETSFGHISTGGGASLELLEGKTLPGLAVLA